MAQPETHLNLMMIETCLKQQAGTAVVLTMNQRLTRHLIKNRLTEQNTPQHLAIYPIHTWVKTQVALNPESPVVLSPSQERQLWKQVGLTQSSPIEDVQRAWQLIHRYAVPLETLSAYPERSTREFVQAAQAFQARCQRGGWITHAELPTYLATHLPAMDWEQLSFYTVGFHTIEPDLQRLIEAIADQTGNPVTPIPYGQTNANPLKIETHAAADERSELYDMIQWAISQHQACPTARIACIVPHLATARDRIDFALKEVNADLSQINISGAQPLSSFPLISHAIEQLSLLADDSDEATWSQLLHTPCFYSSKTAHEAGIALDCLRAEENLRYPTLSTMRALIKEESHPLSSVFNALIAHQATRTSPRRLIDWISWSYDLFEITGWPGYRPLNSTEHQLVQHFSAHLGTLVTLDTWLGEISYPAYLALLREETQRAPFQGKTTGEAIQILGLLEAADLPFDALWIMRLSETHFPPAARPNPLLPIALQQQHDMPHASPDKEYAFAQQLLQRLCQQSPHTLLSHAAHEDNLPVAPSPLIRDFPPSLTVTPYSPQSAACGLTHVLDHTGPPLQPNERPRGGTRILSHHIACPFKAFMESRLHARALPKTDIGIPAKQKGIWLHHLMQRLWETLESHEALVALSASDLDALIKTTLDNLIPEDLNAEHTQALEKERLLALARQWLALESERAPFTVLAHETPIPITIGALHFTGRIDRIDQLDSGEIIFIDYKTGLTSPQGWATAPPTDPQLPIYAVYGNHTVNQIAFAQVRTGALAFKSLPEDLAAPADAFEKQKASWKTTLNEVSTAFASGEATLAPESTACRYCDLNTVCKGHVT